LPSPWLVGPLLLAYLLVVGPVNYLVLRQRLHRPALVWVSTPLISILFASSFYGIGSRLQGSLRDDEIQLLKVAPQGAVSSFEYNQVLFASRGDHQLGLSGGSLVAPMTLSTYQDFAATCTRCLVQLAGVQVGEEHVTGGSQPAVSERGVAYGSVRVVGTAAVAHAKFGVVPHLVISGGHLKGSLTNEGASALYNLALFASDGTNYQRIGLPDLPPHATVQVDSAPESVGTTTLAPGMRTSQAARLDVIENAIAMAALAQSPQPVLVGFSDLQPGRLLVDGADPPRIGIAAFEQPLGLDGADGTLAEWSRIRLAAIAGTSPNFEDVYDIELPPAVSSFDLVYDSRLYPSLELYDWAAGAWRQVPGSGSRDQTVKVGGAMIADGVVRVRVKESQITWGTALGFQG
jgi:hypothetical protein